MTLLELIIKSSTTSTSSIEPLQHPITLTPNSPNPNPNPNSSSLIQPLDSFQLITDQDTQLIEFNSKFFITLNRKLKDPRSLTLNSFNDLLVGYLEKIRDLKFEGPVDVGPEGDIGVYARNLMVKVGSFVGRDVMGLVIEGCVMVENWGLLEFLISNKLVDHGLCSGLLFNLVSKGRSDFVCLCLRRFTDVKSLDLVRVMRYFLGGCKGAGLTSAGSVRKEWERDALAAIEKASGKKASGKIMGVAKDASVLLMVAYDEFSSTELCLHFLVSSSNVDEVVFASAISKLNAGEVLGLVKYLGKWLSKYERFPQAGPCPEAVSLLGLRMCQWVPRLEDVVKCLGLVVDEHFSSLALHSELHEELLAVEKVVGSLVSEGRLSCSIGNLIEMLKPEVGSA